MRASVHPTFERPTLFGPIQGDVRVYPKASRPLSIPQKLFEGVHGHLSAVVASKSSGMLPSNLGRGRFGLQPPSTQAGESETE